MSLQTRITALAQAIGADVKALAAALAGKVTDAPSDGKQYARKDAGWVEVAGGGTAVTILPYDDRGDLRTRAGADGAMVLVEGLGLFGFAPGSDEPDDDESCFATATGRWLLEAPHWDVVSLWQLPDDAVRDEYDEDEPLRFDSRFASRFAGSFDSSFASSFDSSFASRVLHGTATCAIASLTATTSVTFSGTVTGAAVGDRVIATPPAQLGSNATGTARLSCHAYVSAPNTVTVVLCNASAASATVNPAVRTAWPVTVIKGA